VPSSRSTPTRDPQRLGKGSCEHFIPVQLGWEHLASDGDWNFPGEDDHPWHELTGIEPTGARPTEYETIHEFVTRFCAITVWRDDLPANATPEDAA
jgi:hypothetical protein